VRLPSGPARATHLTEPMHAVAKLIESFAQTTAFRDRDDIDLSVARLLHDFVEARRIVVYRLVDDGADRRVQRRLLIDRDGHEHGAECRALADLPKLIDIPHWYECDMTHDVVHYETLIGDDQTLGTVFPLLGEQGAVGLIEIELEPHRDSLRPREVRLIAGVLRLLGNHLAMLDYGQRDTLTGLLNRKTFDQSFHKILERNRGQSRDRSGAAPYWFAVVDIDRFKSINDRFGHLFGDDVLLLLARLMRKTFRASDQLFRFGGEEFVVVLDATQQEDAEAALERFRRRVAEHQFPQIGQVTVSTGYTRIGNAEPAVTCFDRADAALYFAKAHGRNQVQCYERLIEAGLLEKREESTTNVEFF
jgi:diguanylate cyclase (GGDEF)-like protein